MKIEIWSDIACPFCYIGKTNFDKALDMFPHKDKVEIKYMSFQLNPTLPKVNEDDAYTSFSKSHGISIEESKQKFDAITEHAKKSNLEYRYDILKATNTFDAHRLHKFSETKGLGDKLMLRLLHAYFTEGVNIADYSELTNLALEVGLDKEEVMKVLKDDEYADQVRNEINEGRMIGVSSVPTFVINRKYGVPGAQSPEYFLDILNQIYQEDNPIQMFDAGAGCAEDEECDI